MNHLSFAATQPRRRPTILEDGSADDLLNERQVSACFNIAVKTLQNWRYTQRGPAYQRAGRKILYRHGDVAEWLQRSRVEPQDRAR